MQILTDSFGRKIDYLRLSVTDRCNLRCIYCVPEKGIDLLKHSDMLTYEEIEESVKILSGTGIKKIRITGGEPFVRKDIIGLIGNIRKNNDLEDLSITTNGILLGQYLKSLKSAGIDRINISIDSLNPQKYKLITRGGNLFDVLDNLQKAIKLKFKGLKINTVITELLDTKDIREFIDMSMQMPVNIRFIEMMHSPGSTIECSSTFTGLSCRISGHKKHTLSVGDIMQIMQDFGKFEKTDDIAGFGPSVYYRNKKASGSIGFILNDKSYCSFCNRIRLTPSGKIKLCLFSDMEFDLKSMLRRGISAGLIQQQLGSFIKSKPENREKSCRLDNDLMLSDYMKRVGG